MGIQGRSEATGVLLALWFAGSLAATPTTPADNRLLNDLLAELGRATGGLPIGSETNNPTPWTQPYVLTKATVGGCDLWRFTPLLAAGESLDAAILERDPARFRAGDMEIAIDDGQIVELAPSNSKLGLWIRQRGCIPGANAPTNP